LPRAAQFGQWNEAMDRPDQTRACPQPEPRPPVAARPRGLSVTEIETWMRDPYAIYARRVLRLEALEPLDADPGAAERGQLIHAALDAFVASHPGALPPDAARILREMGREAFGRWLQNPSIAAFWWPRFERIADWFLAQEAERRRTIRPLVTEVKGELVLHGPGGPFTLRARADRIDRTPTGGLAIIDYKTGSLPTQTEIELGLSPQLPLEAAMAAQGGFRDVPAGAVDALEFWRLTGGDPAGTIKPVEGAPADLAAAAHAGLLALIEAFDRETTPYWSQPRPGRAPRYSDYTHLARLAEWQGERE
jgi:ATP-dependent helicase/nuclease subunit B